MADTPTADTLAAENQELKRQLEAERSKNAKAQDDATVKTLREENETLKAEKADRERTDAIMALDEAKGCETQAAKLASKGMSVEDAKDVLADMPKAEADGGDKPLNGAGLGIGAKGSASAKASGREAMIASMKKLIEKDAR